MNKEVIMACCGLFHYRNVVSQLASERVLCQFIFSHRRSALPDIEVAYNIWLKEYALKLISFVFPDRFFPYLFPVLHSYWDWRASRVMRRATIFHVMLHGTALKTIQEAKRRGMIVIGEAVNSHPRNYHRVIVDEARECGIDVNENYPLQLRRLEKEISLCDYIICPSSHVQQSYVSRGYPLSRTFVAPFGADLDMYKPPSESLHRREGRVVVVCVSQVSPRKGIRILLDAWRALGIDPSAAELRIVGRISTDMHGIVGNKPAGVVFTGTQSRSSVVKELQKASIFVLPTLEEGFACAILEALACGCAVVTTPPSGGESIIKDGHNGMIVPANDVSSLAFALRELITDRDKRIAMGERATASMIDGYSWGHFCERLKDIYRTVLG